MNEVNTKPLLKLYYSNNTPQLYINGLNILTNISSVMIDGTIYIVRDECIMYNGDKKTLVQLVKSGKQVYYLS